MRPTLRSRKPAEAGLAGQTVRMTGGGAGLAGRVPSQCANRKSGDAGDDSCWIHQARADRGSGCERAIGSDREASVAGHHGCADLKHRLLDAIVGCGLAPDNLHLEDIGPVDEFHIGGWPATAEIVGWGGLGSGGRVLDIESGLGGLVRFLAHE